MASAASRDLSSTTRPVPSGNQSSTSGSVGTCSPWPAIGMRLLIGPKAVARIGRTYGIHRHLGDRSGQVGRSLEGGVVDHGQLAIRCEVDVELDRVHALLHGELEGGHRVFGTLRRRPPVTHDERHLGSSPGATTAGSSVVSSARL